MAFLEPALPHSQRCGCQPRTSLQQLGGGKKKTTEAPQAQMAKRTLPGTQIPNLLCLHYLFLNPCDLGGAIVFYLSPFFIDKELESSPSEVTGPTS